MDSWLKARRPTVVFSRQEAICDVDEFDVVQRVVVKYSVRGSGIKPHSVSLTMSIGGSQWR